MQYMLLNIFTNFLDKFNSVFNDDFYSAVPLDYIFIITIAIFILTIFLVFITLILPLFKPSSSKLYKRYLFLRDEMKKIDKIYSNRQITFDEYVSMQFLNAQEYYKIVKILSRDDNFKSKLQSYTLQDNYNKSYAPAPRASKAIKPLTKEEVRTKQIDKLSKMLKPKADKYTKEDIYGALVYEGFERGFILDVLKKLVSLGVKFSEKQAALENKNELSDSINNFFGSGEGKYDIGTSESISFKKEDKKSLFKEDDARKTLDFENVNDVDFTFKDQKDSKKEVVREKKPGFFKRLFSFKSKPKEKPSINEIDNILKNIEQEIKIK